ncbi:ABC transporter G family protein [Heterostelium album PN500]|uniref:ABC transporter G family protein n=1 Tax=Heterostelium pallidum (strain ATCC 26659 / Pp 5 / PN500) TaxID=670386 RepID=D3B4E8_HETP5|nr:ABC transporter G family protein [Heterostelium album PN500]EFA84196.1 ABC transporter G family protein [Heterostelium album PN500]|eukprot:XP_020436312.1 ABC transporter G family protein [Heterostelium album PN500]
MNQQIELDLIRKESIDRIENQLFPSEYELTSDRSSTSNLSVNQYAEYNHDIANTPVIYNAEKTTIMERFLLLTGANNSSTEQSVIVNHLSYDVYERKQLFKPKEKVDILSNISFYLKPGMMVLLLAGPSSGKTTLFKCLTNRIPSRGVVSGDLLFGNCPIDPKTHHTQYIYVSQTDNHIPTLTVRETLDFSIQCQSKLPEEQQDQLRNTVLEMLGMKHVEDTVIGNQSIRGVSGGQKKRMTVAVELFKGAKTIFMDEPTSGLDSTTSYELLSSIKLISESAHVPDGQVTFFGSKDQVLPFYKEYGLLCPKTQNPAEFLSNVYELSRINPDVELKSTDDFISAYESSNIYQENLKVVRDEIVKAKRFGLVAPKIDLFQQSLFNQIKLCIKRAFVMTFRDRPSLTSRFLKSVILGLLIGSLFFDVGNTQKSTQLLPSLTFFLLTFVVFGSLAGVQQLFIERPIFYDQQYCKYYHSFAYFSAGVICDLFWNFWDVFIFTNLSYWMIGLSSDINKFLYFLLILYVLDSLVIRTAKAVSVFSSTPIIASTIAPTFFCLLLLMAGYIIPHISIPTYWKWMYYVSPFKWSYEALLVNEVHDHTYRCEPDELLPPSNNPLLNLSYPYGYQGGRICPTTTGDQLLNSKDITTDFNYRFQALFVLLAMYIVSLVISLIGLRYFRYDSIPNNPPPVTTSILARQQKLIRRSTSGVVAMKKRLSEGCFLSFHNLTYQVYVSKSGGTRVIRTLLDNINGFVVPGTLVALMGSSGAGKSTLLDILANRSKNGILSGDIMVNGKPRDKFYNRYIAYVEQEDRLPNSQTIREAISFSANLRLPPDVSEAHKSDVVCYILDVLELIPLADVIIGTPENGISMEQRKRVNIGMELACNPDILFLDEPTTGLDSVSAQKIMTLVKKVATHGRSVICTIHQPAETIFNLFDSILLLTTGGYTAYFGEAGKNSEKIISYCRTYGFECPANKNPAEFLLDYSASINLQSRMAAHDKLCESRFSWVLKLVKMFKRETEATTTTSQDEIICQDGVGCAEDEESTTGNKPDVIDNYLGSDQYRANLATLTSDTIHSSFKATTFTTKHASNFRRQFSHLMTRSFLTAWRKKNVVITRSIRSLVLAFITGTLFWQIRNDQEGVNDRISFIFFSSTFASISCLSNIPSMFEERPLWYRELDSGTYRHLAFIFSTILSDMPFTMMYSCLFSAPVYWMAGLYADGHRFWIFMLTYYLYVQTLIIFSQLLGVICPNMSVANELTGIVFSIFSLFAGFIIRESFIPSYFKFFYQISFTRYAVETLTVNEMQSGIKFTCLPGQYIPVPVKINSTLTVYKPYCPIPDGETVLEIFNLDRSATKVNSIVLLSIFFVFTILILISSRIFKYKK